MVEAIKQVEAENLDKDSLITGLDLVCEEDHFAPLIDYVEDIMHAKSANG